MEGSEFPYNRSQCEATFFGGVGDRFWVRLRPAEVTIVALSTCADSSVGGSLDTDLAVFVETSGEQVACNGDGWGESNCQAGYSRLQFDASSQHSYLVAIGAFSGNLSGLITLTGFVSFE